MPALATTPRTYKITLPYQVNGLPWIQSQIVANGEYPVTKHECVFSFADIDADWRERALQVEAQWHGLAGLAQLPEPTDDPTAVIAAWETHLQEVGERDEAMPSAQEWVAENGSVVLQLLSDAGQLSPGRYLVERAQEAVPYCLPDPDGLLATEAVTQEVSQSAIRLFYRLQQRAEQLDTEWTLRWVKVNDVDVQALTDSLPEDLYDTDDVMQLLMQSGSEAVLIENMLGYAPVLVPQTAIAGLEALLAGEEPQAVEVEPIAVVEEEENAVVSDDAADDDADDIVADNDAADSAADDAAPEEDDGEMTADKLMAQLEGVDVAAKETADKEESAEEDLDLDDDELLAMLDEFDEDEELAAEEPTAENSVTPAEESLFGDDNEDSLFGGSEEKGLFD